MEFSSFFFHLLFFSQILQFSNTIVSSAKVQIPEQNAPTDKLDSLTEQMDADIGKRQVQQRIKRGATSSLKRMFGGKGKGNQFSQILQFSNTIVMPAKVEIPTQIAPTDKLDSLTGQMDEKDADIGKRLVQQRMKRDNEDVVYIDHRRSNCFDEPRSQGNCDASYAFATIAFYEWLHCKQTGEFQAYSEQNIIDCSLGHGNSGCNGGNTGRAMMFIHDHIRGLMLRANYPYTGRQGRCPYDETLTSGYMDSRVKFIPLDQLVEHLQHGPIIIILKISQRLLSYTGGVDDNVGYTPQFLHAMLLIGHGRENGKDYWLFRNSLFTSRSGGYYKLNKNVDCFSGEYAIGLGWPIFG